MSQDNFNALSIALSNPKISRFINNASPKTTLEVATLYFHNLHLAQSLYTSIHIFELALRNNIHDALKSETGHDDWYDIPGLLQAQQLNQLTDAKTKITNAGRVLSPDQIVSELSMGFWVGLFNSAYEHALWRRYSKALQRAFPRCPKYDRTRGNLSSKLNPIRDLRNRVFHHEPIYFQPNLQQVHMSIGIITKWLNPNIALMVNSFDTFLDVRTNNQKIIRGKLFSEYFRFEEIFKI